MSFTNDELKDIISRTLNTSIDIPAGHKGAFVTALDDSGVRTAVAARVNDVWKIQGEIGYHPHEDGLDYGVQVMATW